MKVATARIKIDRLLEAVGWRFLGDDSDLINIRLEPGLAVRPADLDDLGNCFGKSGNGLAKEIGVQTTLPQRSSVNRGPPPNFRRSSGRLSVSFQRYRT